MKNIFLIFQMILIPCSLSSQSNKTRADSIRIKYNMPELAYAIISSDSILELGVTGIQNIRTRQPAKLSDRFRIGSNTKTITSYLAAVLVKKGIIGYDTKFFDLYPELKMQSDTAYYNVSLQDFLTFRAKLIGWTYTDTKPSPKEIQGSLQKQRYEFISWVLKQSPNTKKEVIYWSNPSYVAAGLMLEKATGKSFEILVEELGQQMEINFQFGQPNSIDKNQPWGHNAKMKPEEPGDNYKLNWLSSAGNINVSLPDYAKFIQMQLQGLLGKSKILTAEEFNIMHYGLPFFSYGWKVYFDEESNLKYSYHEGNPGTFLSRVFICKDADRAYIFFTNVQSDSAEEGLTVLFNELKQSKK